MNTKKKYKHRFEWYVYNSGNGWTAGKVNVVEFNVFNNDQLNNDVHLLVETYFKDNDYDKYIEELDETLRYHLSGRSQYECVVGTWPETDRDLNLKISCYDQMKLNLNAIASHLVTEYMMSKLKASLRRGR